MATKKTPDSADSVITLRPKLLLDTLEVLVGQIGRAVCVEGSPGLGKTSVFKQVAERVSVKQGAPFGLVLKHLPTMQPEDFGLPIPNGDKTKIRFIVPDWFPSAQAIADGLFPKRGVLLFDDRNQADTAHQKILANIIQERELHGERLADGWSVASTGNRQSDRAGANKVLTHLRNRETVLEFQPDLDQWCDWAYKNAIRPEVIAFLRFVPDMLSDFDPQRDANPTPRAWAEGVSPIIDSVPGAALYACVAGAVGAGAAVQFMAFIKTWRELPDIDALIRNPKAAPVPENPATRYALCGALAHRANKETFGNIIEYTHRLSPEYSVITVMDSCRKDGSLGETVEFAKWATRYQDVMVRS